MRLDNLLDLVADYDEFGGFRVDQALEDILYQGRSDTFDEHLRLVFREGWRRVLLLAVSTTACMGAKSGRSPNIHMRRNMYCV